MDHRFYDPARGRFTTPDPKRSSMHLQSPLSFNRYVYALDDPINHRDPTGLDCSEDGGCGDWGSDPGWGDWTNDADYNPCDGGDNTGYNPAPWDFGQASGDA